MCIVGIRGSECQRCLESRTLGSSSVLMSMSLLMSMFRSGKASCTRTQRYIFEVWKSYQPVVFRGPTSRRLRVSLRPIRTTYLKLGETILPKKSELKYGEKDLVVGDLNPSRAKVKVTIYLDGDVLLEARRQAEQKGKRYQTLINESLRAQILGEHGTGRSR